MNWRLGLGALAIAGVLALGLGYVSSTPATVAAPTAAHHVNSVTLPDGAVVTGDLTAMVVPDMICVPNVGCGSYRYFNYRGYLTVSFRGRRYRFHDTPWWSRGIEGCSETALGYGFWAMLTSWDPPLFFSGMGVACLTGGIGRIIIP
ncbi:MAG: hypothetical protein ACREN7_00325 [Candidatus Dormibacteria bacterium]